MNTIVISYHLRILNEEDVIIGLLERGLKWFHLRKPDFTLQDYRTFIQSIPKEYHNRIIIHNHYEVLNEFNLAGYYITSAGRGVIKEPDIKCVKATFAKTFDDIILIDGKYDYIWLGPIFKSISKPFDQIQFDHEYLKHKLKEKKYQSKLLAIGGIQEGTTEIAINYGFDGVIILGAIWAKYIETFNVKKAIEKFVSIENVTLVINN